jgi:small conductance mechanosensitive channel
MPGGPFAASLALRAGIQPDSAGAPPAAGFGTLTSHDILWGLLAIGVEVALIALVLLALYGIIRWLLARSAAPTGALSAWGAIAKRKVRNRLLAGFFLLVAGVLAYNGWLMVRGLSPWDDTAAFVRSIDAATQRAIGTAILKLVLSTVVLVLALRVVRRVLQSTERAINQWDLLKSNNQSLASLFSGLERAIANAAWMLLAVLASGWFGAPAAVTSALLLVTRIYLVIAIGLLVIRCTNVSVDTLSGVSERAARRRGWLHYHDRLRPLLPAFRTCLEYALWVGMVALALGQVEAARGLAAWGPKLIQGIGIFFAGRVVMELGSIEIQHRMLPATGLDETDRRRRQTMVPLVRSAFIYATYFGTAVLILSAFGFNPMPFLAGAGILGLVIGFGAQSLIDDVVSGFFTLLENTYLVGDSIEVGPAKGVVEAIEFRTTKIRDADGRLHILRNADVKAVVNNSKEFTMAVVTFEVDYDADLRQVFRVVRAAGERLRSENPEVLSELKIDGITAFGARTMTVRVSTRVKPGRHDAVAAALRLLLKESFDRQDVGAPRTTLIPQARNPQEARPPAAV